MFIVYLEVEIYFNRRNFDETNLAYISESENLDFFWISESRFQKVSRG